ncbi:MAG: hypothetical protein A3E79_09195 [Burkholderiales bacterium RIFCSPHIGHO2_12_FULL_61_11]|nr:MAG: hypothetical protein A3E79_09195 [Burkholderiales bacterium RIFCSPHIGHO2_12_FULL_61_11]
MNSNFSKFLGAVCVTVIGVLAATPAAAVDLTYGSWLGTKNVAHEKAFEPYFEMVRKATDGKINWKLVGGAQLANGPATPEAVGSNLMYAGLTMAPYQPRMLPATNLIFSQSLPGDDYLASVGAMNEVVMLGCPECRNEYERNNAVAFAGYGTAPYLFMCRGNVASINDMKGLKIRASGGGVDIVKLIGATPVSMPPTEATSGLERGTIDCVLGAVGWLSSYGYMDVVKSVVNAPMGMGGPPLMMYVNRGVWKRMTPAQRKAHIDFAPDLVTNMIFDAQIAVERKTVETAKARGIKFVDGGKPFADIMRQHDKAQFSLNADNARTAGVSNPEVILKAYIAAYAKWKGIIANKVGDDREKFRDALWREVYSKVNPETL